MPLSVPLNSGLMPLLCSLPVIHALVLYDINGDDENFLDAITTVMPTFKSKILMVEVSSEDYHILHQFGIESASDLPQLILIDPSEERGSRKFSFIDYLRHFHQNQMNEGEDYEPIDHNTLLARFTNVLYSMWLRPIAKSEDNDRLFFNATLIEHFFRLFLEDENVQSLNSQDLGEIAKLNELTGSANIENLASSQFEARIMHDANTDNFVFFHAPWCIHCKAIEAIMVELADHFRHDSSINFFRIDAQKNEIAHSQVKLVGLPSMFLFSAEDKRHPLFYDGDRSLQGLVNFIEQNRHSKPLPICTEVEVGLNGH
jgi:thiol-disulfide isomerase/thioredoxin